MHYRLDRPFVTRAFGWHMVRMGIAVIIALTTAPAGGAWRWVSIGAALVAAVSFALALRWLLGRPPVVLTLDENGYRASRRAGGARLRGTWASLERVRVTADGRHLVFESVGAEPQTFWLGLVGGRDMALQAEISRRLNAAHGYRPLS